MKKKLIAFCTFLLILLALLAALLFFILKITSPVTEGEAETVRIEIPSGMSVSGAAALLEEKGLIRNSKLFYYVARYPQLKKLLFSHRNKAGRYDEGIGLDGTFVLRSGIYYISPAMDIVQIQSILASGQQEYIKVSLPEGLTISKIAAELEENRICPAADFISICKNADFAAENGIAGESLEGFLFPDTYFLTAGMNAASVARIMIENFFAKIQEIPTLAQMNAKDLYQTVTLASIVEREYRVEDEAPLIASVFKNRLRRNIGLYSCATVEYILTEIEGRPHPERILIEDTKIDNPYNTYKWAGLPPGPISNPGMVALRASSDTPKTNYYFFQIVDPAAGRHVFTTSFEEHVESHSLYTKSNKK